MMNAYRETDKKEKRTFSEWLKDLREDWKLNIATSTANRNKIIKNITKLVPNLDVKNPEKLEKISKLIIAYDLCSSQFGKTLDETTAKQFAEKLKENGTLPEIESAIADQLKCYELNKEIQQDK